eukprot:130190-Prymnesium_polylepis.1
MEEAEVVVAGLPVHPPVVGSGGMSAEGSSRGRVESEGEVSGAPTATATPHGLPFGGAMPAHVDGAAGAAMRGRGRLATASELSLPQSSPEVVRSMPPPPRPAPLPPPSAPPFRAAVSYKPGRIEKAARA